VGHDSVISRRSLPIVALVVAALVAACDRGDPGTGDATARSYQARTVDLAAGRLPALPSGPLYVRVVEFAQDAGSAFTSHQHVPGFVHVLAGVHRLIVGDGPPIDLGVGESFFLGSLTHRHLNPAPTANHWYFIALWPTPARAAPLADPAARVAFATPDLPAADLPPGVYVATLQLVTLGAGGRSAAHRHGGVEILFVLEGTISARSAGARSVTLRPGEGIHHLPNTVVQEFNPGDEGARYLAFLLTAEDRPLQTNVKQSPAP
jgi:quercetin dioxygenase-like cupin family protein